MSPRLATERGAGCSSLLAPDSKHELQKVVTYDDLDQEVGIHCPQCNAELLFDVAAFIEAINHIIRIECPDCQCDFSVDLTCQTRAAQYKFGGARRLMSTSAPSLATARLPRGFMFQGDANWYGASKRDPRVVGLFARHYSSKKNGHGIADWLSFGITSPGAVIVLLTADASALFVWLKQKYHGNDQIGINCAVFRNEGKVLSSTLILEAEKFAWKKWAGERLYTYVDPGAVNSSNPGYCFKKAGWQLVRDRNDKPLRTKNGLLIFEKLPCNLAVASRHRTGRGIIPIVLFLRKEFCMSEITEFERFHPRAVKLLRKRKQFIVVACDEPYFIEAYSLIRSHEMSKGSWSEVDERVYRATEQRNEAQAPKRPCPVCEVGKLEMVMQCDYCFAIQDDGQV
jgi:hypothetical protein